MKRPLPCVLSNLVLISLLLVVYAASTSYAIVFTPPGTYKLGVYKLIFTGYNFKAEGVALHPEADGNLFIYVSGLTGSTYSGGIVFKLNADGTPVWVRTIGGGGSTSVDYGSSESYVVVPDITFTDTGAFFVQQASDGNGVGRYDISVTYSTLVDSATVGCDWISTSVYPDFVELYNGKVFVACPYTYDDKDADYTDTIQPMVIASFYPGSTTPIQYTAYKVWGDSSVPKEIDVSYDGNLLVFGYYESLSVSGGIIVGRGGDYEPFIMKINPNDLTVYFTKTAYTGQYVRLYGGGSGPSTIVGVGDKLSIFVYDLSGNFRWGKLFSTSSNAYFKDAVVDENGNIYVYGASYKTCPSDGIGRLTPLLAKFDANGNLLWAKYYADGCATYSPGHIAYYRGTLFFVSSYYDSSLGYDVSYLYVASAEDGTIPGFTTYSTALSATATASEESVSAYLRSLLSVSLSSTTISPGYPTYSITKVTAGCAENGCLYNILCYPQGGFYVADTNATYSCSNASWTNCVPPKYGPWSVEQSCTYSSAQPLEVNGNFAILGGGNLTLVTPSVTIKGIYSRLYSSSQLTLQSTTLLSFKGAVCSTGQVYCGAFVTVPSICPDTNTYLPDDLVVCSCSNCNPTVGTYAFSCSGPVECCTDFDCPGWKYCDTDFHRCVSYPFAVSGTW